MIGTALALLLSAAWASGVAVSTGVGALLFVAVPVADMSVAIVRRARARRPLFTGDRGHVYDQLVDRGRDPAHVTILCIAAQVLLTVIGLGLTALPAGLAIGLGAVVVIGVGGAALRVFTAPGAWS